MKKQRFTRGLAFGFCLALALLTLIWAMTAYTAEEPEARSYNTLVYTEQGGAKLIVESGGEIEVQSGATLDVQSGATTDFSGGIDMDGAIITNIGNAGTDFTASTGGLTTAGTIVVTAGGITVTAGALDMTTGQILNVGAAGTDFSATGGLTLADDLTITSALFLPGYADETITDGETLTPTLTVYAMDSGSAVTVTLPAVGTEGQLLFLIGDDTGPVVIADSDIRTADGNALSVGPYDVVGFVYQDAEWILLFQSNNS